MPHCSVMSIGTSLFISKLKFSCNKYSVEKVWTKIYCHFYFRRITLTHYVAKALTVRPCTTKDSISFATSATTAFSWCYSSIQFGRYILRNTGFQELLRLVGIFARARKTFVVLLYEFSRIVTSVTLWKQISKYVYLFYTVIANGFQTISVHAVRVPRNIDLQMPFLQVD